MIKCDSCGQKIKWIQIAGENGSSKLGARSFKMQGLEPVEIEGWVDVKIFDHVKNPKPGIYCKACHVSMHSENSKVFMQHSSLSDSPLIFTPPEHVDLDKVVSSIKKTYGKSVLTIVDSEKERVAQRVSIDKLSFLSPAVQVAIERKLPQGSGIYHHQRDAIEALIDGQNVIIATDTSSGKSLCFQAAILENAVRARKKGGEVPTALYLGPLNALIDDQFKSLSEFADKVSPGEAWQAVNYGFFKRIKLDDGTKLGLAQYHGNVSIENGQRNGLTSELRRSIRGEQPEVLFSNPEMLGRAILPLAIDRTPPGIEKPKRGAGQWEYFFKRLRLIVLDECHVFRGIFGSHMANLIRRIIRICNIVGNTNPICFALCSATIREPEVFGARLIGHPIDKVIDRHDDTSERHSKKLVFIGKKRPGQPVRQFAKGVIDLLISKHRLYTIAFQESVSSVQSIHNELKKSLNKKGLPEGTSSVFTANFLSDEKSKMLNDLRLKKIKGIISTSALALGIDIGSLSASILITYPGTISKAWQMLGRAGRRGPGLQIFLVGENFLDQYWAKNAAHFVDRDLHLEEMIINPDNEYVLEEHLIAANYDYPLDTNRDRKAFGPLFDEVLKKISTNGNAHLIMTIENGKEVFNFRDSSGKQVFAISLRGTGKFKVPVYENSIHGRKLLEDDQVRAIRTLYPGAIFIHGGRFWQITALTYDKGQYGKNGKFHAVAIKAGQDQVITVPEVTSDITVESTEASSSLGPLKKNFGSVSITTRVDNYFIVPYESDKDPDEQGTSDNGTVKKVLKRLRVNRTVNTPSEHEYTTEGLWLEIPDIGKSDLEGELLEKALFTAAKAIVKAIPIHQYAVPEDIKFEIFLSHPATGNNAAIFLYENQAGGVGIARRTYEIIGDLLKEGYKEVLKNCPRCSSVKDSKGCPACVADIIDRHDRQLGMEILKTWITDVHKQSSTVSTAKILPIDPSGKTELPIAVQC